MPELVHLIDSHKAVLEYWFQLFPHPLLDRSSQDLSFATGKRVYDEERWKKCGRGYEEYFPGEVFAKWIDGRS